MRSIEKNNGAGNGAGWNRNLIRQIRRHLEKENQTIRNVKGEYYIVDLRPWRVSDIKNLAHILGIPICEFCGGGATAAPDGVAMCRGCESELNGKVEHLPPKKENRMRKYLSKTPRKEYPSGVRLVHNFYPGPDDDPGRDRRVGLNGFRIWVTDEPNPNERRCYCGWLNREHYGTVAVISQDGSPN